MLYLFIYFFAAHPRKQLRHESRYLGTLFSLFASCFCIDIFKEFRYYVYGNGGRRASLHRSHSPSCAFYDYYKGYPTPKGASIVVSGIQALRVTVPPHSLSGSSFGCYPPQSPLRMISFFQYVIMRCIYNSPTVAQGRIAIRACGTNHCSTPTRGAYGRYGEVLKANRILFIFVCIVFVQSNNNNNNNKTNRKDDVKLNKDSLITFVPFYSLAQLKTTRTITGIS